MGNCELPQRYRKGQEDQLVALGLVVNFVVLWNTIYSMPHSVSWWQRATTSNPGVSPVASRD